MARKTLGKSRRIKTLTRYAGDVALYDLSKSYKISKDSKADFFVIAVTKPVSGLPKITVWASNKQGETNPKPVAEYFGTSVKDALNELGYTLI